MFNPGAPHCSDVAEGVEQRVKDDMTTGEGSKQESEPSLVQKAWEGESTEADKDELTTNDFSAAATQLQVLATFAPAWLCEYVFTCLRLEICLKLRLEENLGSLIRKKQLELYNT